MTELLLMVVLANIGYVVALASDYLDCKKFRTNKCSKRLLSIYAVSALGGVFVLTWRFYLGI